MADPDPAAQRQLIEAARKKDRIIGLAIVVLTFALGLGLSWWAKLESRPEVAEPPGPPTTEGLSGYPTNVDPVVALKKARSLTKRIILRGMVAEGVKSDGTIDVIASGHDPRGPEDKRLPFADAEPGMAGAETLLAMTLGLVRDGVIDMPRAFMLLAGRPAELLGVEAGSLAEGREADLCLVDPDKPWIIDSSQMAATAGNTPFDRQPTQGRATAVIKGGVVL